MKKIILPIFVMIVAVISLTGCRKTSDLKLQIKESYFNGWVKDYKPQENTEQYEIKLNQEYVINSGHLDFTITKINKDSIEIKTQQPFRTASKTSPDHGEYEFTVKLDEELMIKELTQDAGYVYYLTLVK